MSTRDVGQRLLASLRSDGAKAAWDWLSRTLGPSGAGSRRSTSPRPSSPPSSRAPQRSSQPSQPPSTSYPGDFTGRLSPIYAPQADEHADPGEIVWAWVPFEEDHSRGKDRPVLIVGRDDPWLLGLQLTSQDHDLDEAQEAREGRYWVDIGAGDWDQQRRPSEVRINRVIRIAPGSVRRIGARLDRRRFGDVTEAMTRLR